MAFGFESILLSLQRSECPEFLNPFLLCPALPDSLDGRDSVEYYGFGAPTRALVTYPPIPKEARASSGVAHTAISPLNGVEGRRLAASQQEVSAQRSPHRTSSFHHIRRSNSGCFSHFRTYILPLVLRA